MAHLCLLHLKNTRLSEAPAEGDEGAEEEASAVLIQVSDDKGLCLVMRHAVDDGRRRSRA